jgi:hypothetical protein
MPPPTSPSSSSPAHDHLQRNIGMTSRTCWCKSRDKRFLGLQAAKPLWGVNLGVSPSLVPAPFLKEGRRMSVHRGQGWVMLARVRPSGTYSFLSYRQYGQQGLAPFPRDALQEYIATCGAARVRVKVSETGQAAEAEL